MTVEDTRQLQTGMEDIQLRRDGKMAQGYIQMHIGSHRQKHRKERQILKTVMMNP